jgi:hypothetical protein
MFSSGRDTPTGNDYYSINSFYSKYNIKLTESYSFYKVDNPLKYNKDNYGKSVVTTWATLNQKTYNSFYKSYDILIFIIQGINNIDSRYSAVNYGQKNMILISAVTNEHSFSKNDYYMYEHARFTIAHEIGHCFGSYDHYTGTNADMDGYYKHSLMCKGGRSTSVLTKGYGVDGSGNHDVNIDTIFTNKELSNELHFNYVTKLPRSYFIAS